MKSGSLIICVVFLILLGCSKNTTGNANDPVPVVEAELVHYIYEFDTENKTFVWDYKVKFTNISKVDAVGFPAVYHKDVKGGFTFLFSHPDGKKCPIILAGEECIFSYYESGEYDADLAEPGQNLVFERAEYIFEE